MIFLINAFFLMVAAACWNRVGAHNITFVLALAATAVINAALSYPFVAGWLQ